MNWYKVALSRVVYHGTKAKFNIFDENRADLGGGLSFGSLRGPGIYFTNDKTAAQDYGSNVIRARISINKPFYVAQFSGGSEIPVSMLQDSERSSIPDRYFSGPEAKDGFTWNDLRAFGFSPDKINALVRQSGYDGIIGEETSPISMRKHTAFVVFSNSQVSML